MKYLAGIDLGGTKIAATIVSSQLEILTRYQLETPPAETFDRIGQAIQTCLVEAIQPSRLSLDDLQAVGVGVPGPVDQQGCVAVMPNLGLEQVNVAGILGSILGKPVVVENDVNLATLAEFHLGAGVGLQSLYGIIPGTGVGGGYIIDGRIVTGKNNTAGEIGHMVVKMDGARCGCGQKGCLEAYVSRIGFARQLSMAHQEGRESLLMQSSDNDFQKISGAAIVSACQAGDPLAHQLLDDQARILGIAVANVVNLTGVEGIVIGGSVYEHLGDELLPTVREIAEQHIIGGGLNGVRLALSRLKGDATTLGAVLLASQDPEHHGKNKNHPSL